MNGKLYREVGGRIQLELAGDELARVVEELGHAWRSDGACPLCAALRGWRAARHP